MVSIITVNYNGLADTCEMIASFRKHETHPYEIIVVDNGSRMPEADEIKLRHPEVKVVQNTNTGFAGGNNAGLTVAEGNYLFFLNNDTIIKEPILETLIHRLEAAPQNGGVSPMLKYSYAPDTLQYAGFTPFSRITLRNAALRGGKRHTWMSVICGMCFVQLWHLPCSTVAFAPTKCGICELHERVDSFQKAVASGRGGALSGIVQPR
jgi:GT2 family glycosyltransferase